MQELIKKRFSLDIYGQIVEYDQLTMQECIEWDYLMRSKKISIGAWFTEWVKVMTGNEKLKPKDEDIIQLYDVYVDTAMRGYYGKSKGSKPGLPSSSIMYLSSKLGCDPLDMIARYTPEALNRLSEGIERNENLKTKEGQARNQRKLNMMEVRQGDNESDLEAIKKMREKRNLARNNQ